MRFPRAGKLTEADRFMGVGAEGRGKGELVFKGDRVSVWEHEKFWK